MIEHESSIKEVLGAMPRQSFRDGGVYNWGPEGNKARAVYLAATRGRTFDPTCPNCESDLITVLLHVIGKKIQDLPSLTGVQYVQS